MKRIFYITTLALAILSAQSCLIEEKNLFEQTAAERLDSYVKEIGNVLQSSENGWSWEYYADENQSYGGYVHTLKFSTMDVTVYSELDTETGHTKGEAVTSLYKVRNDDSAVLVFDTYNDYIHYFANPNINDYQAKHGDFEFNVTGLSEDRNEIYLRGLRTGNNMKLKRLTTTPEAYMKQIEDMKTNLLARKYTLTIAGATNATCAFSKDDHTLKYNYTVGEEKFTGMIPYCYSTLGIRFYEPVEINGTEYDSLIYGSSVLSSSDGKINIVMSGKPSGN